VPIADKLNVLGPVRVIALADVGPFCGNWTSVPAATVAALSGGINAKKSAKSPAGEFNAYCATGATLIGCRLASVCSLATVVPTLISSQYCVPLKTEPKSRSVVNSPPLLIRIARMIGDPTTLPPVSASYSVNVN
jgi:hypothetical protein